MKKRILLIITWVSILIIFIIPFNFYFMQKKNIEAQIEIIPDDQILIRNDNASFGHFGLTKEDQEEIELIDGIEQVEYGYYDNYCYGYEYNINENLYSATELSSDCINISEKFKLDQQLDYLYGGEITKENGIVISENFAIDLISGSKVNKEIDSIEQLIGQEISGIYSEDILIIEGIYSNDFNAHSRVSYNSNTGNGKVNKEIIYDYGIIKYSEINKKSSIDEAITIWNNQIAYSTIDDVNNRELAVYDQEEYTDEYGTGTRDVLNYQASFDNGVKGMIDPTTANQIYAGYYPDANITLSDDANKNQVISDLKNIENIDYLISDQLAAKDIKDQSNLVRNFLIAYTLIILILITKYIKNKKDIIKTIVLSFGLVIIAQVFVYLMGYNISLITTLTFITINLMITLIIYLIYLIKINKSLKGK